MWLVPDNTVHKGTKWLYGALQQPTKIPEEMGDCGKGAVEYGVTDQSAVNGI